MEIVEFSANLTYRLTNLLSKYVPLAIILKFLTLIRLAIKPIYQKKHTLPGSLVVSLTSHPPRFSTLNLTIQTLLSQSVCPDKIILYIHKNDFDFLPKEVVNLKNELFEIATTPQFIRSYTKIIPALIDYPDSFIATVDDDLYYNFDWLEELVNFYDPKAKETIGHRAHRITFDLTGKTNNYLKWQWCIGDLISSQDVFLTGVGGVLYPPNSLHKDAVKTELFMRYCSTADDVWLHFMTRLNGFTPKKIPSNFREFSWHGSQVVNLNSENVDKGTNDLCIKKLEAIYGSLKSLCPLG